MAQTLESLKKNWEEIAMTIKMTTWIEHVQVDHKEVMKKEKKYHQDLVFVEEAQIIRRRSGKMQGQIVRRTMLTCKTAKRKKTRAS